MILAMVVVDDHFAIQQVLRQRRPSVQAVSALAVKLPSGTRPRSKRNQACSFSHSGPASVCLLASRSSSVKAASSRSSRQICAMRRNASSPTTLLPRRAAARRTCVWHARDILQESVRAGQSSPCHRERIHHAPARRATPVHFAHHPADRGRSPGTAHHARHSAVQAAISHVAGLSATLVRSCYPQRMRDDSIGC